MIIPDLNLPLYAYNTSSPYYSSARIWWERLLSGSEAVGLPWAVALGFIRITTNPRIYRPAIPVEAATGVIRDWLSAPNLKVIHPGPRHPAICLKLIEEAGVAGNLTTDAHLAALAIEYDAVLHTVDGDFFRFPDCRWKNPLSLKK